MSDPAYPDYVAIEVDLGSGWEELPDVQVTSPINISRGIQGTSQRDRVASTGTMSFVLNNAENNSQGKIGLYSLNHTNTLTGWRLGIPVRCVITFMSVEEVVFVGTIAGVQPTSGIYKERKVFVDCVDWMEEAAKAKVRGLEIQFNKRSDEILAILLAAVKRQPVASQIGIGGDTYPYALDNATEEVSVLTEFQRLAQSELSYIFTSRIGTFVHQGRHRRPNLFYLSETLTGDDIEDVETERGREEIINKARVEAHPRRLDDAATSVLFQLASTPKIEQRVSVTVNAIYRDPDARATRVGGIDMVTPLVAYTDYSFNTSEDGTGTDITSQLEITVSFGGTSAEVAVYNRGPFDGYLTKLNLRGRGVYAYETVFAEAENTASQNQYGENVFPLDMPYQTDLGVAQDAANFIVAQNKDILTQVTGVTFIGNREARLMRAALTIDIGERVRVEEDMIGTAGKIPIGETLPVSALEFFVNGVNLIVLERQVTCSWIITPADAFNYWTLDRAGFTELDISARLGYGSFIAGWVVDESEVGIGTRVNY